MLLTLRHPLCSLVSFFDQVHIFFSCFSVSRRFLLKCVQNIYFFTKFNCYNYTVRICVIVYRNFKDTTPYVLKTKFCIWWRDTSLHKEQTLTHLLLHFFRKLLSILFGASKPNKLP